MSPDIPPHLTNNLRDLDLTNHSIGNRSLTHSPDQIKLSGGSSPILGVSNGWVWGGLLFWLKLIYSFSTHITNYFQPNPNLTQLLWVNPNPPNYLIIIITKMPVKLEND